jgi:hypothetical protein
MFLQNQTPRVPPSESKVRLIILVRSQLPSSSLGNLIADTLTVGLEELGDDGASLVSLHQPYATTNIRILTIL